MKKQGRMTISVPNELKARVEAAGESVSWSAVACAAFEAKLGQMIEDKGARDMQDVVTRLRATKAAAEGEDYRIMGRVSGAAWARDRATAGQLGILEKFREQNREHGISLAEWFERDLYGGWTHADALAALFMGYLDLQDCENDEMTDVAERKSEDMFQSSRTDLHWLRGYVEGALDVWGQVKDQI
ncbi:MAG: hypothetical protein BGO49_11550 [Planctomycetales bacterium 71-10]|nr:MAG: hypothetical protein BGO49_11550 [Planctomycetales bacterium 71-10]